MTKEEEASYARGQRNTLMLKRDLTSWNVKYFDAAVYWLQNGALGYKEKPHHRHYDKIMKPVRLLEFARDVGLDDMCIQMYQNLRGIIQDDPRDSTDDVCAGKVLRTMLLKSECTLIREPGSTIQQVLDAQLRAITFELDEVNLDLEIVEDRLKKCGEQPGREFENLDFVTCEKAKKYKTVR